MESQMLTQYLDNTGTQPYQIEEYPQRVYVDSEILGEGAENTVKRVTTPSGEKTGNVLKESKLFSKFWKSPDHYSEFINVIRFVTSRVPHIIAKVLKNTEVVDYKDKNNKKIRKSSIYTPFITNIDEKEISWGMLKDDDSMERPENTLTIKEQLFEFYKLAKKLETDNIGLDPLGFSVIGQLIPGTIYSIYAIIEKCIPEVIKEKSPDFIKSAINSAINKLISEGKMKNIIFADEDFSIEGDDAIPYNGTGELIEVMKKWNIYFPDLGLLPLKMNPSDSNGPIEMLQKTIPTIHLRFMYRVEWAYLMELLAYFDPSVLEREDCPFKEEGEIALTRAVVAFIRAPKETSMNGLKKGFEVTKECIKHPIENGKKLIPDFLKRKKDEYSIMDQIRILSIKDHLNILKKTLKNFFKDPIKNTGNLISEIGNPIVNKTFDFLDLRHRKFWRSVGLLLTTVTIPMFERFEKNKSKTCSNPKKTI